MGSKVTGVKIKGIGKYVPEMVATNEDFTKIVETSDEWITQRTGIKQRHITNGEPTYYLGAMAAKAAMADAGVKAEDIDLIIATTVTGDYFTPSLSCLIQREIGAIGCIAFDLNAACAGFVYGFDTAKRYLQTGDGIKTVLLVASEELSKFVDYTDRSSCVLFGDGAAAFVLETAEDTTYSSFLGADGNGAKYLASRALKSENAFRTNSEEFDMDMPETKDYFFKQDGKEVYKFATKALPNAVEQACAKIEISPDDLDWIVPHQANIRIIETAAKHLGVSMDKFPVYIDRYGNTSSASIPIAFCDAVAEGRIKRGDKVCLVGFGGGLTYGAAMGAAVMIMASMSAIGASAYQASYEDSYRIILAYTSYTPSETDSVGTVTNLSTTKTNYSVQSTLYYKTSAAKIGSYTPSGWKKGTLSKGQLLKATTTHNRNTSYKYSARTLVMKDNRVFKDIQSDY